METFLIEIVYDPVNTAYMACYSNGANILLGANSYHDAVLEADMMSFDNIEYGYN